MDVLNLLMSYAIRDHVGEVARETFKQIIEKDMKKEEKTERICGGQFKTLGLDSDPDIAEMVKNLKKEKKA